MGLSIFLQAAAGLVLIGFGIYGEIELYTQIDSFFLHFMFVPGAVLLLSFFHFLAFKTYERKYKFAETGGFIALVVCLTGQILVLFYDMFPVTWIPMMLWYILCAAACGGVVMFLNLVYVVAWLGQKKSMEE